VLLEVVHHVLGNRPVEGLVGRADRSRESSRPRPRSPPGSWMTVCCRLSTSCMPHQRRKARASASRFASLRVESSSMSSRPVSGCAETLEVLLHPVGRVSSRDRSSSLRTKMSIRRSCDSPSRMSPSSTLKSNLPPRLRSAPRNTRNHGVQFLPPRASAKSASCTRRSKRCC